MKALIIGCGAVAPMHCQGIMDAGHDIVAFCDTKPEKAEALRDKFAPSAKIYTSYRDMIDSEECDAVHISTPHHLHYEMARYAIEAGRNVYLEKPVCRTAEEAMALTELTKNSPVTVTVSFQNRFLPVHVAMLEAIEAHGGAACARSMLSWYRSDTYYTESDWRGRDNTEGGSAMINQAIHTLDLMLLACGGKPVTVQAAVSNKTHRDSIETEDTCEARITFEGGAVALMHASTSFGCDGAMFIDVKCRDGHSVAIYGSTLLIDGKEAEYPRDILRTTLGKDCWGTGHVRLIAKFYEAIAKGEPTPLSVESAAVALYVLKACYRSNNEIIRL